MATNVEALKDLYVKAGGSATSVADVETSAGMIEKLGDVIGGGSGGGGQFVVTLTLTGASSATYDKPFDDIITALENGQSVIAKISMGDSGRFYYPSSYQTNEDSERIVFNAWASVATNGVTGTDVVLRKDGTAQTNFYRYPES